MAGSALLLAAMRPGLAAAEAHATLRAVSPADGAALDAAPAELLLQCSAPVAPLAVRLEPAEGCALEAVPEPLGDGSLAAPVRILPGVAGWNRLEVSVPDRPPREAVQIRLQPPSAMGEPVETLARPDGVGAYRTDPLLLLPAGTWRPGVGILLDPFTRAELAAEIEVR